MKIETYQEFIYRIEEKHDDLFVWKVWGKFKDCYFIVHGFAVTMTSATKQCEAAVNRIMGLSKND